MVYNLKEVSNRTINVQRVRVTTTRRRGSIDAPRHQSPRDEEKSQKRRNYGG
jgi:hypothetical protein